MTRTTRCTLALALAVAPLGAGAQTIWTPLEHVVTARIELWHPHVKIPDAEGSISSTSGPLYFSAAFPVNDKVALHFELPYARAKVNGDPLFGDYADNSVGNPYIGVQLGRMKQRVSFVGEIGGRISAANENSFLSLALASLADPERVEAFAPKTNTLAAAGNVIVRRPTSSARFRVGVTQLFSNENTGIGNHTMIDYGAQASVDVQQLRFGGALTGRYLADSRLTGQPDSQGTFSERSNHFATGSASYDFGSVRPLLNVRLPFEKDVRDVIPWTVGFGVEFTFR